MIMEKVINGVDKFCGKEDNTAPELAAECSFEKMEEYKKNEDKEKALGCRKKKMWCGFWKKERNMAIGFLAERVRPLMDGFFVCVGAGECKKEEKLENVMMQVDTKEGGNALTSFMYFDAASSSQLDILGEVGQMQELYGDQE